MIEGLQHIGLYVNDVETSLGFYRDVLGFSLIHETVVRDPAGDVLVKFVRLGDCTIELVQHPQRLERGDGRLDHIALRVKEIDAVIEQLEEKGIVFEEGSYTLAPQVFPPKGSKWIMFRGPDGEHLELNENLNADAGDSE